MNKYAFLFCLSITFTTFAAPANTEPQAPLLIKFQQDIFAEVIRSHGHQIESEVILDWCKLNELSGEIKLSNNELKRAVFDSFIVAGTKNVKATEISRQMSNDDWDIYNHALFSDIRRYKDGITKGLVYAFPDKDKKQNFCRQSEVKILELAQRVYQ